MCVYDKFLCEIIQNIGFDTKIIELFLRKKEVFQKKDLKKGI
jgi:hypothetical protein